MSAPEPAPALPALAPVAPGLYRHYKGGWYEVLGQARCSETLEGMVLYRPLYGAGLEDASAQAAGGAVPAALWVRPAAMFQESGLFAGRQQPRFAAWAPAQVPLGDLPTARALVAHLHGLAARRGMDLAGALRPPPPEPDTCCGRGCNGCVWEGFYAALGHWRSDALALLAAPWV